MVGGGLGQEAVSLELGGWRFKKFTAIGIYIERSIISHLALTWKGKTAEELNNNLGFFMDIVTCQYQKFIRVSLTALLTGPQFSEKVSENCQAFWEAEGTYGEAKANALQEFKAAFKNQNLPPGSSILLISSPTGLVIAFSKGDSIPDKVTAVIENKAVGEAYLASVIGKNGVSPAAKASLAERLSQLM
ncbi:chalcone--flavanone isomerase-like [Cryptomeria japonica]|uniref:chalcone--flavanone isomerase-like n=1 Tax=Cryptomeria japonica TaxID=3369 RepID=UPI0027DA6114|nr:chalcone--flavanone isomerase-like [Cryptomeria japonica]